LKRVSDVTRILQAIENGDARATTELLPLVYQELRRLAHQHMNRERPDHTLQTSALINEAYLRFTKQRNMHWQNRAQFFAIASRLMRRVTGFPMNRLSRYSAGHLSSA
jgi:RNA polymerase sigma factor (TIGR02999 family)